MSFNHFQIHCNNVHRYDLGSHNLPSSHVCIIVNDIIIENSTFFYNLYILASDTFQHQ
jgi:hypothetical protein